MTYKRRRASSFFGDVADHTLTEWIDGQLYGISYTQKKGKIFDRTWLEEEFKKFVNKLGKTL